MTVNPATNKKESPKENDIFHDIKFYMHPNYKLVWVFRQAGEGRRIKSLKNSIPFKKE